MPPQPENGDGRLAFCACCESLAIEERRRAPAPLNKLEEDAGKHQVRTVVVAVRLCKVLRSWCYVIVGILFFYLAGFPVMNLWFLCSEALRC